MITPRVLTGEEWSTAQTAPAAAVLSDDPIKKTTNGYGRVLTGAEWSEAQRKTPDQIRSWKIPALAPRDVTITPATSDFAGKPITNPIIGPIVRQLIQPVAEHPLETLAVTVGAPALAASSTIGALVVGAGAFGVPAYNVARYGYQKAKESQMTPEDRAKAEADPDRVSGEAAAMQAILLGLAPLVHVGVRSARRTLNFGEDFSQGIAEGARDVGSMAPTRFSPAELEAGGRRAAVEAYQSRRVAEDVQDIKNTAASTALRNENLRMAGEEYQAQRVTEDLQDIAAARQADAERVLGLREEPQDLTIRRRPGGAKPAPFFESQTGAETLGATAARHGMPADANPYHPASPLAADWDAGHAAATQSYPVYPEGFSMGGPESRIPAASELPKTARGSDVVPEGATPENVDIAASLRPSQFRGHSTDDLVQLAQSARQRIETAQSVIDTAAPGEVPVTAERAVTRAKSTLAQVEREFALRGVTGDKLAQMIGGETEPFAGSVTPIEGTGATRARGLAQGVQEKAVTNKLDIGLDDVPQYRAVSMADQAQRAESFLRETPDLARQVALGDAPAPQGLLPESVFTAVENRAIAEGDIATLRELATGKLTSEATTMGQRIRALGERDPESPVAAIQDVINSRTGGAAKAEATAAAATSEVSTMLEHVAGVTVEEGQLTKFIAALKC